MEIPRERYLILGILCHLNHPEYLKKIYIKCVEDIFSAIEEIIEDKNTQLREFEIYYSLTKDENEKDLFLDKITCLKLEVLNMTNQLNFIKKK
jgi:hypothetical protein